MSTTKLNKAMCSMLFLFTLSACQTGYKPASGGSNGFSVTKLESSTFEIDFKGSSATKWQRVKDFTLLKSAEVALKNGFSYFQIISNQNTDDQESSIRPSIGARVGSGYRGVGVGVNIGLDELFRNTQRSQVIKCYQDKPENGFIYNAKLIRDSLRQKYNLNASL